MLNYLKIPINNQYNKPQKLPQCFYEQKALRKQRFPQKKSPFMMSAPLLKPSLAGKAELDSESPPTS